MKKTIYVGMALTVSPKDFRTTFYNELNEKLQQLPEVDVLYFLDPSTGTPEKALEHNRTMLKQADLMIGICDFPSTGLGMEIVERHNLGKPLLLFAHKDATITRMVVGFSQQQNIPCIKYKTVDDIVESVKKELINL